MEGFECNGTYRQLTSAGALRLSLYCFWMGSGDKLHVWIGLVGVIPRQGCQLLPPNEGAFVNFLTLATNESEYRAKVTGALFHYCLELLEIEDVRPISPDEKSSPEILSIAAELEKNRNPEHVRYATFNIFPRVM
jgi:hypothetical protein